jgi:hypothetical protein
MWYPQNIFMKEFITKHSTVVIVVSVLILISLTGYFIFRKPKTNTNTYHETRIMTADEDPNASYMTVTVPGFSQADLEKTRQEKTITDRKSEVNIHNDKAESQSEPADTNQNENTNTNTNTNETAKQTQTGTSNTQQTETKSSQPTVVDHYYTDNNGNRISYPNEKSNTVYVIKHDKENTLTEKDVQNIILKYLGTDTQTNNSNNSNNTTSNSKKKTTNTTNTKNNTQEGNSKKENTIDVVGGDENVIDIQPNNDTPQIITNDDDVIVYTDETKPSDTNQPVITVTETSQDVPHIDIDTGNIQDTVTIRDEKDIKTDATPADSSVQVNGTVWDKNDGVIYAGVVGASQNLVTKLEWDVAILAGRASIADTEDDFRKTIHLDDGSAVYVTVTVTFKDGTEKTSAPAFIAHKNYAPK